MPEVESVTRGLEILRLVNETRDLTLAQVAARSGLSRGTAYRMLFTLEAAGLVQREDGFYNVTRRVLTLSHGFDDDWIDQARPMARELGRELLWPITLSEYAAGAALVRETTDKESPFVFSATKVGFRMSMIATASGRVLLSHATEQKRMAIMDQLDPPTWGSARNEPAYCGDFHEIAETVRRRGYDVLPMPSGRQTALAVPISNRDGKTVAALAVRYFNAAMSHGQAVDRFVRPLQACAERIGSQLGASMGARH